MLPEEIDTINRLTNIPIDLLSIDAIVVVTNIYRVAQGLRNKMEQQVLSQYGLSWTAFSMLYDLWIWESIETKKLPASSGVSKATVSNITNTLEKKELCYRKRDTRDKRNIYIALTDKGKQVIEALYPLFHKNEIDIVSGLSLEEQKVMTNLLRKIIRDNRF